MFSLIKKNPIDFSKFFVRKGQKVAKFNYLDEKGFSNPTNEANVLSCTPIISSCGNVEDQLCSTSAHKKPHGAV